METKLIKGYKYIGITEGVCSGKPSIVNTRIKPEHVVFYGSIQDAMEDFGLTEEQVKECYRFLGKEESD